MNTTTTTLTEALRETISGMDRALDIQNLRTRYADAYGLATIEVRTSGTAFGTVLRRVSEAGTVDICGQDIRVREPGGAAWVEVDGLPRDIDPDGYGDLPEPGRGCEGCVRSAALVCELHA